jgi:hypothetical protein
MHHQYIHSNIEISEPRTVAFLSAFYVKYVTCEALPPRPADVTSASFPNLHLWPHLPRCATCSDPARPSTVDVGTRQCSAPNTDRDYPVAEARLGRDVGTPPHARAHLQVPRYHLYHHPTQTWGSQLGMHKRRASLTRSLHQFVRQFLGHGPLSSGHDSIDDVPTADGMSGRL